MTPVEAVSAGLCLFGAVFFTAGTLGLLRFPDVHARLHALAKADSMGLGLTVLGLALVAPTWAVAVKLFLIWGLALVAGATGAQLIAGAALRAERRASGR